MYIYAYIFHNIWEVFDARKFETKEPLKNGTEIRTRNKAFPRVLFRAAAVRPVAVTSRFT